MSKQFIEGNVYVFTKKKYVKDRCKVYSKATINSNSTLWVNRINGNQVIIDNSFVGSAGGMRVCADWCKCIKNNNPKIEGESI